MYIYGTRDTGFSSRGLGVMYRYFNYTFYIILAPVYYRTAAWFRRAIFPMAERRITFNAGYDGNGCYTSYSWSEWTNYGANEIARVTFCYFLEILLKGRKKKKCYLKRELDVSKFKELTVFSNNE